MCTPLVGGPILTGSFEGVNTFLEPLILAPFVFVRAIYKVLSNLSTPFFDPLISARGWWREHTKVTIVCQPLLFVPYTAPLSEVPDDNRPACENLYI